MATNSEGTTAASPDAFAALSVEELKVSPMRESVHDNWIYAQAVDHERGRLVLYTVWPHSDPPEYTDIVFDGVVVHHFEQQKVGSGLYPANVLFDVEEANPLFILGQYEGLLARTKNYGWPVSRYDGLEDL